MKKLLYILVLFLLGGAATYAYELHVDTVRIWHRSAGETFYSHQYIVTVTNTDTDSLWIWFDYEKKTFTEDWHKAFQRQRRTKDADIYIFYHILHRPKGSDFSMFNLLVDDVDFTRFWRYCGNTTHFLKRVFHNRTFTIIVYDQSPEEKPFDIPSVLRGIRIYRQQEVFDAFPYIENSIRTDDFSLLDKLTYPYDAIVYPISQLGR